MGDRKHVVGVVWVMVGMLVLASGPAGAGARWPQFRGAGGLGVAGEGEKPVVEFGASKNLKWKVAVPKGHSCPVIWDDRIFLTGFEKGKLETICINRGDGKVLWRQAAPVQKIERYTSMNSPATPTPVTDGQRVYVFFGSFGLLAYDFEGKEVWRKEMPIGDARHGTAASPILAGGKLIVNGDQEGWKSFLIAVDPKNGQTVWQARRPLFFTSHTTPIYWKRGEVEEVVVAGSVRLVGYDLKDGAERWSCRGLEAVSICPSLAVGEGMVFAMSYSMTEPLPQFDDVVGKFDKNGDGKLSYNETAGIAKDVFTIIDMNHDGVVTKEEWEENLKVFKDAENGVFGVKEPGKGDVTGTAVAWKEKKGIAEIASPLYYRGRVYVIKGGGMASCFEAKTGKAMYLNKRIGADGQYYASPIAADGKIYVASMLGVVSVYEAGAGLKGLAENDVGEAISATPGIGGDCLYVRTNENLWAFGK
ncbi:MAG: PQQ-binding-like beta-propeller repeat protein [Planctomycetota bacterium]|nr:PQQ-binding-like beta-propeller repeat protein [Planctomycetota bacterium]